MLLLSSGHAQRSNRQALRDATRNTHDQAEAFWSAPPGASFPIRRFLKAMLRLHHTLGHPAAIASCFDHAEDIEQRRIEALLRDLGGCVPDPAKSHTPNSDAAWGVLYALNGSAMGAGVLLKEQPDADTPAEYLNLMSTYAKSGQLGAFYKALNRQVLDQSAAEEGARLVFSEMIR